jgi:hypothetical protein
MMRKWCQPCLAKVAAGLMAFLVVCGSAIAAEHFVAPRGLPTGTGEIDKPWDLATALLGPAAVKPGDTIWLRAGTYGTGGTLVYRSTLQGTPSAPILVRAYPGEHAKVDGGISIVGRHVWFWGFEITNSSPQRTVKNIDKERPRGIVIGADAVGTKIINMVIHDVGRAGVGGGTNGFEIYGTLFWGNGIYDRRADNGRRGEAVYLNLWKRDADPTAVNLLRDNIAFNNFNMGLKIYSEWPGVYIDGYHLEGNVAFNNGSPGAGAKQGNLLVRSERFAPPIKRLKVLENFSYRTSASSNPYSAEFGCKPGSGIQCADAVVRHNYFVAGRTHIGALRIQNWQRLELARNTIVGSEVLVSWIQDFPAAATYWDLNHYRSDSGGTPTAAFVYGGIERNGGPRRKRLDITTWRSQAGVDDSSAYSTGKPKEPQVFIRPNHYERGSRAHIVVLNWPQHRTIEIDLSAVGLPEGAAFEIVDAQNYFGAPIASGVFRHNSPAITLDLSPDSRQNPSEFSVFVLRKIAG